jgi:hypothetical protein
VDRKEVEIQVTEVGPIVAHQLLVDI